MTKCDLDKFSTFHTKNLRWILHIFWPQTISNQQLLARWNQKSTETIIAKAMGMDQTCHQQRAGQHHPQSPTLDTRRKTQVGTTQEHLASDCGRGAQDPKAHLENHSKAGPEQTGVAILCCCRTCLTAFMGMSQKDNCAIAEHQVMAHPYFA